MFSQVDSALTRSRGGLGVGLSLIKGLVELHGGSVEAQSDGAGTGSQFTVRLPVAEIAGDGDVITATRLSSRELRLSLDTSNDRSPTALIDSRRKRILVVDDNKVQAQSLTALLDLMGFESRPAFDGAGALGIVEEFTPDVALIDIGLPDITGYELARRLREVPRLNKITLIAQTGWGRKEDRELSSQAGFNYHLTKPLDHDQLEQILRGDA
jgi:CheY-like chemotaxis protein